MSGFFAVANHTEWGAAWSGDGLALAPIKSESLRKIVNMASADIVRSSRAATMPELATVHVGDNIVATLDYNNCGPLLKAAFGAESNGVYTFGYTQNLRILVDRDVSRLRVGSAKVTSFRISAGSVSDAVELSLDIVGQDCTNVADAFPALSFTNLNFVMFKQAAFYIGDLVDALGNSDKIAISSFTFSCNKNYATDIYATVDATHTDASLLWEPVSNGFRETTLEIELPAYASDAFFTWKAAGTPLQAVLLFTDSSETVKLELPQMLVTDGFDAETTGPERRRLSGTLTCYLNDSNTNSGSLGNMGTIVDEARLTVT